jgi:hypothetical protein
MTSEIRPLSRLTYESQEVARLTFGGSHPKMDAEAKFLPQVVFEKFGAAELKLVMVGLSECFNCTTHILKKFLGEFPPMDPAPFPTA